MDIIRSKYQTIMNEEYCLTKEELQNKIIDSHKDASLRLASEYSILEQLSTQERNLLKRQSELSHALLWFDDESLKKYISTFFKESDWVYQNSKDNKNDDLYELSKIRKNPLIQYMIDEQSDNFSLPSTIHFVNMIASSGREAALIHSGVPWTKLRCHSPYKEDGKRPILQYKGIIGLDKENSLFTWLNHYMTGLGLSQWFSYQDTHSRYSSTYQSVKDTFWEVIQKNDLINPNDEIETRIFGGGKKKTKFFNTLLALGVNENFTNTLSSQITWQTDNRLQDRQNLSDAFYAICLRLHNGVSEPVNESGAKVIGKILEGSCLDENKEEIDKIQPDWLLKYTCMNPSMKVVRGLNIELSSLVNPLKKDSVLPQKESDKQKEEWLSYMDETYRQHDRSIQFHGSVKRYYLASIVLFSSHLFDYNKKENREQDNDNGQDKYGYLINNKLQKLVKEFIVNSDEKTQKEVWNNFIHLEHDGIYSQKMNGVYRLFSSLSSQWAKKVSHYLFDKQLQNLDIDSENYKYDIGIASFPEKCNQTLNEKDLDKLFKEIVKILKSHYSFNYGLINSDLKNQSIENTKNQENNVRNNTSLTLGILNNIFKDINKNGKEWPFDMDNLETMGMLFDKKYQGIWQTLLLSLKNKDFDDFKKVFHTFMEEDNKINKKIVKKF